MALRSNALCTLDQVKNYLGIEDSHKNDSLELYINAASEMIEQYLGYDPNTQTYTEEVHDGTGSKFLVTNARPITALTTVLEDGDTVDITDFVLRSWYIDGEDYVFTSGNSNYKVTYTAGYASGSVPASIILACVKIAALMDFEAGRTGFLSGSDENFNVVTHENILETISEYRRLDG